MAKKTKMFGIEPVNLVQDINLISLQTIPGEELGSGTSTQELNHHVHIKNTKNTIKFIAAVMDLIQTKYKMLKMEVFYWKDGTVDVELSVAQPVINEMNDKSQ